MLMLGDHRPNIVIPFLLVLSVVVFVHEFGHYWVARRNGVRIEVFSIGFGPELFGRNDRARHALEVQRRPARRLRQDARRRRRGQRHGRSQRTPAIRTASRPRASGSAWRSWSPGPMANFVFAIVALAILFAAVGRPFTPPEVGAVQPDSPAAAAGLLPGDRITAVDGRPIESFEQLQAIVLDSDGQAAGLDDRPRRRDHGARR